MYLMPMHALNKQKNYLLKNEQLLKKCGPQFQGEKSCEIQAGNLELALVVRFMVNFNNKKSGDLCSSSQVL